MAVVTFEDLIKADDRIPRPIDVAENSVEKLLKDFSINQKDLIRFLMERLDNEMGDRYDQFSYIGGFIDGITIGMMVEGERTEANNQPNTET